MFPPLEFMESLASSQYRPSNYKFAQYCIGIMCCHALYISLIRLYFFSVEKYIYLGFF